MAYMANENDAWSISVKTVGGEHEPTQAQVSEREGQAGTSTATVVERNFTVKVSPNDSLSSLYNEIEVVTGLKASQQRLIYRGRLLNGNRNRNGTPTKEENNPQPSSSEATKNDDASENEEEQGQKIRDIVGLGDGHTIHLVRKRERPEADGNRNEDGVNANFSTPTPHIASEDDTNDESSSTAAAMSSIGTASLLTALLGMSPGPTGGINDNDDETTDEAAGSRRVRSLPRFGSSLRRRTQSRLTSDDLEVPDPGSMEPVRQGLMTLHTMLPCVHRRRPEDRSEEEKEEEEESTNSHGPSSTLDTNRVWYRGQWIDCRDTVNQWLEATVVDIVQPDDIIPPRTTERAPRRHNHRNQSPTITRPTTDPAVESDDLEGRRRLLLEPCEEDDSDDEGGELAGFRQRRENVEGLQLLLIHYNGWPHRWDEWIRSDSERIRPFRVRTRHPTSAPHVSPTVGSVFAEAPSTNIRHDSESRDREALLPELNRIVTAVNEVLSESASDFASSRESTARHSQLPWQHQAEKDEDDDLEDLPPLRDTDTAVPNNDSAAETRQVHTRHETNKRELETLAPLLDRLGRCLIDAAPHVAALASTLPEQGRIGEAAEAENEPLSEAIEDHSNTLGGLLSLLGRERRRQSTTVDEQSETTTNDPDFTDFATGMVNTSRGVVRSGPRSRSQSDDVAGLLGAYLAAASVSNISDGNTDGSGDDNTNNTGLGRINGGGGIDIHIHAVVTAPGTGTDGLSLATLGGGGSTTTTTASNLLSQVRDRRNSLMRLRRPVTPQQQQEEEEEEEDMGIFSELYSENPDSVDPNNSALENELSVDDSESSGNIESPPRSSEASLPSNPSSPGSFSRRSPHRSNGSRLFGRLFRRNNSGDQS